MKIILTAAILCLSIARGEEILRESNQLSPRDLNMYKWDFRQKTDSINGAVMRVEREICGTIVEQYEEVIYLPDNDHLGSLLVFNSEIPLRIELPGSNQIKPEVDRVLSNIATGKEAIKGTDGIERESTFVRFQGENETIRIFFYKAPFSIYREQLKDMPDTTDGKYSGFRWRYEMIKMEYSTRIEIVNEKQKMSLINGPNKAKHASPRK